MDLDAWQIRTVFQETNAIPTSFRITRNVFLIHLNTIPIHHAYQIGVGDALALQIAAIRVHTVIATPSDSVNNRSYIHRIA